MQLIGRLVSPFTRRVAIAMTMWDMPYEVEPISTAEQDRVREFNPLGRVPALVLDDGEVLIDSLAIVDALAETAGPDQQVLPLKGAERRQVLQANAIVTGAVEKLVAAYYERTQKQEGRRDEAWQARLIGQAVSGLAALDARKPDPWLCGFGPSLADITVATGFDFIGAVMPDVELARFAALQRTAAAIRELPAYARTAP